LSFFVIPVAEMRVLLPMETLLKSLISGSVALSLSHNQTPRASFRTKLVSLLAYKSLGQAKE
jgi:hypothetical protein